MGNLCVGTNEIVVKDAILQVNRNIHGLQKKLSGAVLNGYASVQIRKFYEDKIESQQVTLEWLSRAL